MKNPLHESERWLDQALNDWEFIQWLSLEKKFYDKGCFIAQQSAEKALKACLYANGERYIFIHSTFELASKLVDNFPNFRDILDCARRLDRFYIPTRYPDGLPGGAPYKQFSREDFDNALNDCAKIIELT
ncbi:MAG: DNA-binding protein, partial [Deltaproteobacteria bacterium CG07_land_8_20_14_0_80_38_7]